MILVKSGLDVFLENPDEVGRVGLLSNVASLSLNGRTAFHELQDVGIDIQVIFSPEHGYFGRGAAGESIPDDKTNEGQASVPIISLYGTHFAPPADQIRALDTIIIDLQDVGARWYTFLATVRDMLIACAGLEKPVLILDRPNPLGGVAVEGLIAEPTFLSMVAPAQIPVRYGLTMAEIAQWMNDRTHANLTIIPMEGWRREMFFSETGLFWSAPSPNMPRPETALLYVGTCLVEGTNISEGRGTALPFEQFGAPFINGEELTIALNDLRLPGVRFTPVWFRPTASKHQGQDCAGSRIHVIEDRRVNSFGVGLHVISTIRRLYPEQVTWRQWGNRNGFEQLTASESIREALEADQPIEDVIAWCDAEARTFQSESAQFWLYD